MAIKLQGRYCAGLSKTTQQGETVFQIHYESYYLDPKMFEEWRGDFEAHVKALQVKRQLARNGYILTGFEENEERIVLRIKQAV
ncbi:MAG: hypothetical protein JSU72_07720 [Deltaproteobacteria bacterium]|nr:MAG: hypothetical protein JSU72_07720 [Deltaproteobacteria bacterium]